MSQTCSVLSVQTELISEIIRGREIPIPESNILWVFFPKNKSSSGCPNCSKIANRKPIWIGFHFDLLKDVLTGKSSSVIKFSSETAVINHKVSSKKFTSINLTCLKNYSLDINCHQVQLKISNKNLIYPLIPQICTTRINRTVLVDAVYGNDKTGKIEEAACPFRTIQAAIKAIQTRQDIQTKPFWEVRLSVGTFPEVVTLPSNVFLVGVETDLSIISGLLINGSGSAGASRLTIQTPPSNLNAVSVFFNSEDSSRRNKEISLKNINISVSPNILLNSNDFNVYSIINLQQQTGSFGNILLKDIQVNVDLSTLSLINSQIVIVRSEDLNNNELNSKFDVEIRSCNFRINTPITLPGVSNNSSFKLIKSSNTNFSDVYSKWELTSIPLPNFQQTLFESTQKNFIQSHPTLSLILPQHLDDLSVPKYLLWKSQNSKMKISNVHAIFENVPDQLTTLAETFGVDSKIKILSVNFSGSPIPSLNKNNTGNDRIVYAAYDQDGSFKNQGALATRIRKSSTGTNILPSDQTLLVDTVDDLTLFDVPTARQTQIVRGTQITVINTLLIEVNLNGTIYGYRVFFVRIAFG